MSGTFLWQSLQTVLALLLVCVLAYLALRFGLRRMRGVTGDGSLRLVARLALEPRRNVYLVEACGRCFLIGSGEAGVTLLAEVAQPPQQPNKPSL